MGGVRTWTAPGALVAAALLAACSAVPVAVPPSTGVAATSRVASQATPAGGTGAPVTDVLARLAVKGRAPQTGYSRDRFGSGWADTDRDGCSTREEILRRDLRNVTDGRSGRCAVVAAGVLRDPYSGRTIAFRRGNATSEAVQIDHVVALDDAWQKGAQQWTPQRREAFANDPMNLLAVDGPLNQAKGAGDAATWLPPATGYRCSYVARQVAVKARYGLWVTAAERDAVRRILTACPGQRVPTA